MRMTKAEKQFTAAMVEQGCIICERPAHFHHILEGRNSQRRRSHYLGFPLCPEHHQTGGLGVAIHAGAETWRKNFGSEYELFGRAIARMIQEKGSLT